MQFIRAILRCFLHGDQRSLFVLCVPAQWLLACSAMINSGRPLERTARQGYPAGDLVSSSHKVTDIYQSYRHTWLVCSCEGCDFGNFLPILEIVLHMIKIWKEFNWDSWGHLTVVTLHVITRFILNSHTFLFFFFSSKWQIGSKISPIILGCVPGVCHCSVTFVPSSY